MNDLTEQWVMRPVLAKVIGYEALIDGSLGLEDLAVIHEALDVESENQARVEEAYRNRPR